MGSVYYTSENFNEDINIGYEIVSDCITLNTDTLIELAPIYECLPAGEYLPVYHIIRELSEASDGDYIAFEEAVDEILQVCKIVREAGYYTE